MIQLPEIRRFPQLLILLSIVALCLPAMAEGEGYKFSANGPTIVNGAVSSDSARDTPCEPVPELRFQEHEFQVDLFGLAAAEDLRHGDVSWGAGIGLGYFFTRQFGFGASARLRDYKSRLLDQVAFDVIARQPIGDRFAPYLIVGANFDFDRDEWLAHAGLGGELRFTPHVGTFAEVRWETDILALRESDVLDEAVARGGLRLSF